MSLPTRIAVALCLTRGLAKLGSSTSPPVGRKPILPQIPPVRIIGFDQSEFPFPPPLLDQLFAGDGRLDLLVPFGIDQPPLVEVRDMDRALTFTMLVNPPDQIGRYSHIHSAAVAVCHDVNPAALFHGTGMPDDRPGE